MIARRDDRPKAIVCGIAQLSTHPVCHCGNWYFVILQSVSVCMYTLSISLSLLMRWYEFVLLQNQCVNKKQNF